MRLYDIVRRHSSRVLWWLLSVPIYVKILGISGLIAVVFAAVVLYEIRGSMARGLYESLERRTLTTANSLSQQLEPHVVVGDLYGVHHDVRDVMGAFPEVRYVIVEDARGQILAHTFGTRVPPDLLRVAADDAPPGGSMQVLDSPEGLIFEATVPVLNGTAGRIRLGASDTIARAELSAATRSVLLTLLLCLLGGGLFGLFLTYVMIRPIHLLVLAADRIRSGDFQSKAEVFSGDEIGKLAVAFNRMGEALDNYRREVEEKETARRALIERIVQAQEEERRRIARELHDQLGQSLSSLLLTIESARRDGSTAKERQQELENRVRNLIDEVRLLAWKMRPSILDDYGLDSALQRYVQELSKRSGISIDYQGTDGAESARLPSRMEVALYRIAQEALTNVQRHAHAQRASVVLLQQAGEVTLLVEDDGVGFDPSSVQETTDTSLGLTGMEERATLLGGSFVVESAPGSGTVVRVSIPVGRETECQSES